MVNTANPVSATASETAALVSQWDAETGLMTEAELAEFLAVNRSTLRVWAREGIGPRRLQIGPRCVRYSKADGARWLAQLRERTAGE